MITLNDLLETKMLFSSILRIYFFIFVSLKKKEYISYLTDNLHHILNRSKGDPIPICKESINMTLVYILRRIITYRNYIFINYLINSFRNLCNNLEKLTFSSLSYEVVYLELLQ